VPARRPIASRSPTVYGSGRRPSSANSGGRAVLWVAWFSPARKASTKARVSGGQAASMAGPARPKSRMRSAWSISVASGPATSAMRPRLICRSSAICAPRRCPCTTPSATARSWSVSASIHGTRWSFQRMVTARSSGKPVLGSAASRWSTLVARGASAAQPGSSASNARARAPGFGRRRRSAIHLIRVVWRGRCGRAAALATRRCGL